MVRWALGNELYDFRQGSTTPLGNLFHTLNTCGECYASRAETLISRALSGFLARYGVVLLWKVRWISFLGSEDGVTPCEYEKKVLSRGREPRGQNPYFLAKGIQFGRTYIPW